jgi:hypothetical protein
MKSIEEINHLENCECTEVCTNCSVKHQFKPVELTGNQIADIVTKPKYYKVEIKGVPVDVIDIANAYNLSFMKGNAIKYILRAGKKDLLVQDLKKAIECLQREIEYEGGK